MTDQLNISSVLVNARGNKTAALLNGKERYYVQFDTPAQCLWVPSNFDKNDEATRMGINFEPTEEIAAFCAEFDTWAKAYIQEHSERLFGKTMSEEQVSMSYHSCLKERSVKFKINMPHSATPCRVWDDAGEPLPFPTNWTGCFRLRVKASHLWMMGGAKDKSFGFVMICEDLCPKAQTAASPWAKTLAE